MKSQFSKYKTANSNGVSDLFDISNLGIGAFKN